MSGVLGMLELMMETDLNPEQTDFASTAYQSGQSDDGHLKRCVLDFARLDSGKVVLESLAYDLRSLVYDVCALFRPRLSNSSVELIVSIDDDLPDRVVGDPGRMRQILNNLISNAIKFTMKGHVLVGIKCTQSDQITIFVSDTGIGIEEGVLASICKPFTQADASTNRRFGGIGLGLTIVSNLIELMKGTFDVQSQVDKEHRYP